MLDTKIFQEMKQLMCANLAKIHRQCAYFTIKRVGNCNRVCRRVQDIYEHYQNTSSCSDFMQSKKKV